MSFEIHGWLKRIGYSGPVTPDINTLRAIVASQVATISFENMDVLLGRAMELDDDHIYAKLVDGGRGGYCFELNGLLSRGLRELGFDVRDLAGRVMLGRHNSLPPRTHRMMTVTIDGTQWLVDVGLGGQTPTEPLLLNSEDEQLIASGRYRMERVEEDYQLEYFGSHGWQPLYRFDLQRQYLSDYQMANEHVSLHPTSHFRHHLMLSLPSATGRLTELNRRFTEHTSAGDASYELSDSELYQVLQTRFGLSLDSEQYGISQHQFSMMMQRVAGTWRQKRLSANQPEKNVA
ncbi:N-hydroxyarylamine O-acetyltransferase [Salmonella enterica subsp. enterica serovar Choleraesuis]|nr:N-hydroxyarylamine O-acetyltransferase [Salmonella enterica subsp. enterica serovar Choleraesuis]